MRTLIVSTGLMLTIGISVSLGVASAYAAVRGILLLFWRRPGSDRGAAVLAEAPARQG